MRPSVSLLSSRLAVRLAAVSVVALSAAACSSATERFALSNPFQGGSSQAQSRAPTYTGSVSAVPSGSVTSAPLPAPGAAYAAPPRSTPYTPRQAYAPSMIQREPAYTGSITPVPQESGPAGWSADGGSTIIVVPGDTTRTLAARYGVPEDAIVSANRLSRGAELRPGARIVIPVYRSAAVPTSSGSTPGPRSAAMAPTARAAVPMPSAAPPGWHVGPAPAAERAAAERHAAERATSAPRTSEHVVADGETLYSVAREYHVEVTSLAAANHIGLDHHVRIGERLIVPGGAAATHAEARAEAPRPAETRGTHVAERAPAAAPATRQAALQPAPSAPVHQAVATPAHQAAPAPAKAETESADVTGSTGAVSFRWPVRGRIISGFGPKPNGSTNDGINLAVPAGTPVQAAASGVVAYAGNELKGYGDLVLIRHPGGWVTAYAHNSEILVKKGQEVRRGEVIAKSGKTGAVDAPQLHFELRRGATPVDPLSHMPQG
ncbi:MAG TPA: LysM peptidoglycan-binding domain-containing M23 family metallopeptidase [Hyphomicrobiales bacterium]|nr:LysM peptidoglycan-binding domain-containing M23 family metallopeptidase [Hyphomicrobiales bacterium]